MTLLPTLLVLGLAIWIRRTLESVLAGALFAFFIIDGVGFLDAMAEATLATLMTEDVAWVHAGLRVVRWLHRFIGQRRRFLCVWPGGDEAHRDQAWWPPGHLGSWSGDLS